MAEMKRESWPTRLVKVLAMETRAPIRGIVDGYSQAAAGTMLI